MKIKYIQDPRQVLRQLEFYLQQTTYLTEYEHRFYWQHAWARHRTRLRHTISQLPEPKLDEISYIAFKKIVEAMRPITTPQLALAELQKHCDQAGSYSSNLDALISSVWQLVSVNPATLPPVEGTCREDK